MSFPRGAVVITGASTGIGKACALHLDRCGFRVFAGVRKVEDGEKLRGECGRLEPLMIDVTELGTIAAAAEKVADVTGDTGIAGLVNNAGIAVAGPLEFLAISDLRRQMEVNVIGQVAVTQAFLPMLRRGRGRIVNMGSISGRVASPFISPYSASKFALEAVTDALRVELNPWGIEVSIIEPGAIDTPIWEKSQQATRERAGAFPEKARDLYGAALERIKETAAKSSARAISPSQVARVVEHALTAARPKTRYLVGSDAKMRRWIAALLPDRILDRLISRYIGLESHSRR